MSKILRYPSTRSVPVTLKTTKIRFRPGLLGAYDAPQTPSRIGRGYPLPIPHRLALGASFGPPDFQTWIRHCYALGLVRRQ